jgi:hypothetical protein
MVKTPPVFRVLSKTKGNDYVVYAETDCLREAKILARKAAMAGNTPEIVRVKYILSEDDGGEYVAGFEIIGRMVIGEPKHRQSLIYLLELLCRPADRKALIGCLVEAYEDIRETHGEKRADAWFRVQMFWTAASLLRSRIGNFGMAALGFAASWIGRKIGF